MVETLTIPQRNSRPFLHAADIYQASLGLLHRQFPADRLRDFEFSFNKPIGSLVTATICSEQSQLDTLGQGIDIRFCLDTSTRWLCLRNQAATPEMAQTYSFNEDQVAESISEIDGEYRFTRQIHESNIHLMLSPIKYLLPTMPKIAAQFLIAKLKLSVDVQELEWAHISWRTIPRRTFSITTYFYRGERLGEVTHFFLGEGS